jgi:hypothetical protein
MEGIYHRVLPERIARTTLVVFMDVGRAVTSWSIARRMFQGGHPVHTLPEGAPRNRITWDFVRWILKFDRRKRLETLRGLCKERGVPLLVLKRMPIERQVDSILQTLGEKGL